MGGIIGADEREIRASATAAYNAGPMSTARPFPIRPPAPPPPEPTELDITVIVPVLNEAETVAELSERVAAVLERLGKSFEILFVDDGSGDGTPARVREPGQRDPRVKLVRLRRNFGKAAALSAGFDHSIGRDRHHHGRRPPGRPGEIPRFLATLEERSSTWSPAGSGGATTR